MPVWFLVVLLVIVAVAVVLAVAMGVSRRGAGAGAGGQNTTIVEGRAPADSQTTVVEKD